MRMKLLGSLLAALALAGCGETNGGEGTPDAGTPVSQRKLDAQAQLDKFQCPTGSPALVDGLNQKFTAGGREREFYLQLPKNAGTKPVGVIWAWHGLGDNIDNWRQYLPLDPDGRADFPFVVVTPEALRLDPLRTTPKGIDWDLFVSAPGDANLEGALFEAVMGCLKAKVTIDVAHVHSFGFSAGAIMTGMIHSRYPKLVHGIATFSGAWFNDAKTIGGVRDNIAAAGQIAVYAGLDKLQIEWNALQPTDTGAVLLSHGGPTDQYKLDTQIGSYLVIDFELSSGFSKDYLKPNQRGVVDCPHQNGHQPPPYLTPGALLDFFQQNPLPDAPGAAVLPASLAAHCSVAK